MYRGCWLVRKLTLIAPGLLGPWPAEFTAHVCEELDLPLLSRWLSRAERHTADTTLNTTEALLAETLDVRGEFGDALPMAALAALADGVELTPNDAVVSIDPVNLNAALHGAQVCIGPELGLTQADADELAVSVVEALEPEHTLLAATPYRWYLRLSAVPDIETHSPHALFGPAIEPALPYGADGSAWRARLTEIQMLLFAHPLNEVRERAGQPSVNSVWIWGQGCLPAAPLSVACDQLFASAPACAGMAQWAQIPHQLLPADANQLLSDADTQRVAAVFPQFAGLALHGQVERWRMAVLDFEQAWLVPLNAALSQGLLDEVVLELAPHFRCRVTRAALRRFWRRTRPLPHWISDA